MNWFGELHRLIDVVTSLPRVQASRFDQSIGMAAAGGYCTPVTSYFVCVSISLNVFANSNVMWDCVISLACTMLVVVCVSVFERAVCFV